MMKNYRVMFVCHGNICRSPMAEFILKQMCAERGVLSKVRIESSATSTEEIYRGVGNPIYPEAAAELKRHGVPYENRRAVLLTREDYDKYDLFVCMDDRNLKGVHRIFGSDPECKTVKLMDISGRGGDVPDPWYFGNFESVYQSIREGCEALLSMMLADGD